MDKNKIKKDRCLYCQELIDSRIRKCPYCGYFMDDEDIKWRESYNRQMMIADVVTIISIMTIVVAGAIVLISNL